MGPVAKEKCENSNLDRGSSNKINTEKLPIDHVDEKCPVRF